MARPSNSSSVPVATVRVIVRPCVMVAGMS
jgi:hypothetical protein